MTEVGGYRPGVNANQPHNSPVTQSGNVAQPGGVKGSQQAQKAPELTQEQSAVVQQPKLPTITRRMTPRDVVNQLLQMGVRPTAENRSLAVKMLMHGLELSSDNINSLGKLLKGLSQNSFTEQAAIVLLSKGINSRTAVQQLANFLENNPQLSGQLAQLADGAKDMQAILSGQNLLSPELTSQLSAVMSSLDGFLDSLPKALRDKISGGDKGMFNKSELLTNMRAVSALLKGVGKQVAQATAESEPSANNLLSALGKLSGQAREIAENIIVQAIISKAQGNEDRALQEQFAYWQIPNLLADNPHHIELLVAKDKATKYRSINPKKTKLILKTETDSLGEVAIEVDVEEDNLDFRFNTNAEDTRSLIDKGLADLKEKLAKANYNTRSVKVLKKNLDVKSFLIPTLNLTDLTRVQTEA